MRFISIKRLWPRLRSLLSKPGTSERERRLWEHIGACEREYRRSKFRRLRERL